MSQFDREMLRSELTGLAASGVYIGTSSWKYEGWLGQVYDPARYVYRSKFAKTRFERGCLTEYAEVFKTVCVDAAYYAFPAQKYLEGLAAQVPDDFQFAFKVTDDITIKRFPNLARFGLKAAQSNPNFLNADLFATAFLGPCSLIKSKTGILIFEFSHFHASDFTHGREFVSALDIFLGALPQGWRYGVEMRNRKWLQPDYFATLHRHGVAHVLNNWTDMPSVAEQMTLPGNETAGHMAARFLLKPGRNYEQAVALFQPYRQVQEPNEEARAAATQLAAEGVKKGARRPTFIYVNNRLEGNSPSTIAAILARLRAKREGTTDDAGTPE